jgi:hypothetical protein
MVRDKVIKLKFVKVSTTIDTERSNRIGDLAEALALNEIEWR